MHLGALIGGLLRLGSLVEVLLLAGQEPISDLLHRRCQGLLLLQGDLTLVALAALARRWLIE